MQKELVRELIDDLEAAVNNGGFHQYFFNSAGSRAEQALLALEAIGANQMADILRSAIKLFPDERVPTDWNARQDILERIAPESDEFYEFDKAFYNYPDDLAALLELYVSG